MKFVFWQNIISLHQSAFLRNLAQNNEVLLVAESETISKRKAEGWNTPDMGDVNTIISPTNAEMDEIVANNKDSVHVFSGTYAYPMVRRAFTITRPLKVKTLVLAEPFNFLGLKGLLRLIRTWLQLRRIKKSIDGLLPTGELGMYWYKRAGFSKNKMFQWGYFTETPKITYSDHRDKQKASMLFVGNIDNNKNILYLVDLASKNHLLFDLFTIVGKGPLECELNEKIKCNNINYIGTVPNKQIPELMQKYDLLVLPSKYDGWGAVVNEALQNGMRVVCSENCGAYSLLDDKTTGEKFYFGKNGDGLEVVLKKWLEKGAVTKHKRQQIREWAERSISGNVAATYFIEICEYVFDKKGNFPIAPWMIR